MTNRKTVIEVNFDCLVGPTHHFGGLAFGNLASTKNKAKISNPKKAALQGLEKMHFLMKRGFVQGVLPPHERPHIKSFKNLGFSGRDNEILRAAYLQMPTVFTSLCSSSAMWAANAATVSPKSDSADNKTHISPANLVTMFHRSIEHEFTTLLLRQIFGDEDHFTVHEPLLGHDMFSDEGAANHNRLTPRHDEKGLQIFVHGKLSTLNSQKTKIYPCRQSQLANVALALRHRLDPRYVLNVEQNPLAVDKGAFHNDVVAVVNENLLLCHELAFTEQEKTLSQIIDRYRNLFQQDPVVIEIKNQDLSIDDAVSSYIFNSQILTKDDGKMLIFAPLDCEHNTNAKNALEEILAGKNPIDEIAYFDVSESMANGGGPACLRLRLPLSSSSLPALRKNVVLNDDLYSSLKDIINSFYVEELTLEHFFDAHFLERSKQGLSEIAKALDLFAIYDFQRNNY